jgi:pimeloyl-ACP methyl ester carboxylesterase
VSKTDEELFRLQVKLEDIPELPAEEHPFFLLPEKHISIEAPGNAKHEISVLYRETGNGIPIVFSPGLWTSSFSFRNLIKPLAKKYRVILPEWIDIDSDVYGHQLDYTPEQLAGLCRNFIEKMELTKPIMVGHAESGLAGLLLGFDGFDNLHSLVVISAALKLSTSDRIKGQLLGFDRIGEHWMQKGFKRPIESALNMLDYADPAVYSRQELRFLAKRWSTLPRAQTTAKILVQTLSSSYRKTIQQKLQTQTVSPEPYPIPLKLIFPTEDRRVSFKQGEKLNFLFPGSDLLKAEGSASCVQVEQPNWLTSIIMALGD